MKNYRPDTYNLKSLLLSSLTFSVSIHILIIIAALLIARNPTLYKTPSAYIVNIVDIADSGRGDASIKDIQELTSAEKLEKASPKSMPLPEKSSIKKDSKNEEIVKESIEVIKAKKKIEKMVALRKIVDIGGTRSEKGSEAAETQNLKFKTQNSGGDYYSLVINKIRQNWIFPESIDKDLLAIITIKIAKDGGVTIGRIEKSSGNALFDRSALRAIASAAPLPMPPQELEIGVRFMP